MQLILSNKTDNFLKVTIFPKKELPYSVFKYSERDRNVFIDTTFILNSGSEKCLYVSIFRHEIPSVLATDIFDSIRIIRNDGVRIKFSSGSVEGYMENLFSPNAEWIYSKKDYVENKFLDNQPVESYDYRFMVSTDKFEN